MVPLRRGAFPGVLFSLLLCYAETANGNRFRKRVPCMTDNYHLGEILLSYPSESEKLRAFLAEHALSCEPDLDTAYGIFDANENLVGCGCAAASLLKCFAVSEELRGQNALGSLLSALIENRFQRGYFDLFVITRREKAQLFSSCGLRLLPHPPFAEERLPIISQPRAISRSWRVDFLQLLQRSASAPCPRA